jgi:hypothetical protein
MENREEIKKEGLSEPEVDETELSDKELDETSGGIIVIGGKPSSGFQSKINLVALNPQPLPPRILGNQGSH